MKRFNLYLERYCRIHKIETDVAKTHAIVREVRLYFEEEERGLGCEHYDS